MELIFEMLNAHQFVPAHLCQKTFGPTGGVIGRGEDCDWVIPDRKRYVSHHHLAISYREGAFFLTDTSSNGVLSGESGACLTKGQPVRIEDGSSYMLGDFRIRARLIPDPASFEVDAGRPQAAGTLIPDDSFLDLDPLTTLDQQERGHSDIDELLFPGGASADAPQRADYARVDMESLRVPELVEVPTASATGMPFPSPQVCEVEGQSDDFWTSFSQALGVQIGDLDAGARTALALEAARLLKQCIGGLQQSLHTRSELKAELRLAQTTVPGAQRNPLKSAADADEALQSLLRPTKVGQLTAEQAVSRAFDDLQLHQVAMLTASRAVVRATLEHFSPEQLTRRLERENPPFFATSGSRWRAYGRYHQALRENDEWGERLMARDFAQAYQEQVLLMSTLHTYHQG
jgi:type VI secretion system protein ImpI